MIHTVTLTQNQWGTALFCVILALVFLFATIVYNSAEDANDKNKRR